MIDPAKTVPAELRSKLKKTPQPKWTAPMLATLTRNVFSDESWIYERKLDGERCLVFRNGDDVRLLSRNRKVLNSAYPELVDALKSEPCTNFIADGEIIAFEGKRTSFAKLQPRMQIRNESDARRSKTPVFYYLFDLIYLNGYDLSALPLRERKELLKEALRFSDPLRSTDYVQGDGEKFFKRACRDKWEGLIAKRADSRYLHLRSREWLKFKCESGQELIVCGYTNPQGARVGFGALLLAYYTKGELIYAGKVGTGFDTKTLKELKDKLSRLERKSTPLSKDVPREHDIHWVTPKLVVEVGFSEWTGDGKLRHPRYKGIRFDKRAEEVVRE